MSHCLCVIWNTFRWSTVSTKWHPTLRWGTISLSCHMFYSSSRYSNKEHSGFIPFCSSCIRKDPYCLSQAFKYNVNHLDLSLKANTGVLIRFSFGAVGSFNCFSGILWRVWGCPFGIYNWSRRRFSKYSGLTCPWHCKELKTDYFWMQLSVSIALYCTCRMWCDFS